MTLIGLVCLTIFAFAPLRLAAEGNTLRNWTRDEIEGRRVPVDDSVSSRESLEDWSVDVGSTSQACLKRHLPGCASEKNNAALLEDSYTAAKTLVKNGTVPLVVHSPVGALIRAVATVSECVVLAGEVAIMAAALVIDGGVRCVLPRKWFE